MKYSNDLAFAQSMDQKDVLAAFRDQFFIPSEKGREVIYLCGNSLGLQPKSVKEYLHKELATWQQRAVEGHHEGETPWMTYHKLLKEPLAVLLGALPIEVTPMGTLTANLHHLMATFYQPDKRRYKIIAEAHAFSSDQYMLESQLKLHGLDPNEALVELKPRPGEHTLRTDDILEAIQAHGPSLALVFIGGVQYYTGQFFDLRRITEAAHAQGAKAGFDLAHAVGNVPLKLHEWRVDFAAWCSYKYLNGSPGGVSGIYIHEQYAHQAGLPRHAGWWGHHEGSRFKMEKGFDPMPGADGWQLSNAAVLPMAALRASLSIFDDAGMFALRTKSEQLTGYLNFLLRQSPHYNHTFTIITPEAPKERGCQLSLLFHKGGRACFDQLRAQGVITDWRQPNVIRVAPVPLYNTFTEVHRFASILEGIMVNNKQFTLSN